MKQNKLQNLKDFSLIIIPAVGGTHKKSIILNIKNIIIYSLAIIFIICMFSFLIFKFTPVKYLATAPDTQLSRQNNEIELLNKHILFLTGELENISALNKRLKYAIMLGDSSLFDSIQNKKKSLNSSKSGNPFGGNIFYIINRLLTPTDSGRVEIHPVFFINPVEYGFISRGFNSEIGHMGIDYSVKTGTNIYATASGYVIYSDYSADDGYMIILMHEKNYISVYKHCSVLTKRVRERVIQGEIIALSGNTGLNTTGPHLHFEIWKDGQVLNPKTVLNKN